MAWEEYLQRQWHRADEETATLTFSYREVGRGYRQMQIYLSAGARRLAKIEIGQYVSLHWNAKTKSVGIRPRPEGEQWGRHVQKWGHRGVGISATRFCSWAKIRVDTENALRLPARWDAKQKMLIAEVPEDRLLPKEPPA